MKRDEKEKKPEKLSWDSVEEMFATSVIKQAESAAKRWFAAWIITIAALIGTNAYWIYQYNSYDYVSQDGAGINNINTGSQGDIDNGSESEN